MRMKAIIVTGGKQYTVAEGDVLFVEKLNAEEAATVKFEQVLAILDGENTKFGAASSAFSFSTNRTSPSATVYCLPPVTIIAFICFTYFILCSLAFEAWFLRTNLSPFNAA